MKNKNYIPKVGDLVYVDSSIYLSHGVDDFIGGLCEITSVSNGDGNYGIEVKEDPDVRYSWEYLAELQDKLKEQFGENRGYQRPDHRPEFNE